MAEPVGCVQDRLHLFPWESCQGRHGEVAILNLIVAIGQLSNLPQDKHRVCY